METRRRWPNEEGIKTDAAQKQADRVGEGGSVLRVTPLRLGPWTLTSRPIRPALGAIEAVYALELELEHTRKAFSHVTSNLCGSSQTHYRPVNLLYPRNLLSWLRRIDDRPDRH
jgi:hypothetical protein